MMAKHKIHEAAKSLPRMTETDYTPHLEAALNGKGRLTRVWRQNAGKPPKRDKRGRTTGVFHGAPAGAADLTGYVRPDGYRLEVELKGPRTPFKRDQPTWATRMLDAGIPYVVCRYDTSLSLEENLAVHVLRVDRAVEAKRGGRVFLDDEVVRELERRGR